MKLQVSSFNVGGSWNAEVEETKFRKYTINHRFIGPAEAIITLADIDGAMLRKYNADQHDLAGAVADDGGAETDEITEASSAAANDMTLLPAVPVVNDAYYFGFDDQAGALTLNVGTAAVFGVAGNIILTWEYSQGADAWAALAGVTDGTNIYRNAGTNNVEWTIPGDWATDEVGAISGKYWVRARLSTYVAVNTVPIGTQAWYYKTYLGAGKITIEDPDATDIFYGRIKRALGNTADRTVTLECKDWLDQLDDEKITYDMREKIGAGDFRQSTAHADPDGAFVDVAQNDAGTYYFYDDDMVWANDAYNTMSLVFTAGMAGTKSWGVGPYTHVTTAGVGIDTDSFDSDRGELWVDNGLGHLIADNDEDFTVDYFFRTYLGHNTPSNFYVHDSITAARLHVTYFMTVTGVEGKVQINNAADTTYYDIASLEATDDAVYKHAIFEIPGAAIADGIVTAAGLTEVRFDIDFNAVPADLSIRYLWLEIDTTTTGTSTAVTINDTINPNKLEVATDLTTAATRIWEGIPYCVAKKIYLHLESATGPILGGDTVVTLTAGAANIENTTGISTTQFKNKSRLDILKTLAIEDGAVFFNALGTATVTYQKTFGAHTQNMSDATVDSWQSVYDYNTMFNDVEVYGAQIGDYEIYQQATNAASILKYRTSKNKIMSNAGLVSDADALSIGTLLAARDNDIQQMIGCTISGRDTTYRLGTVVGITSSKLWATAEKEYQVVAWSYDSSTHKTSLLLHPRSSIGMQEITTTDADKTTLNDTAKRTEQDLYIPDPITHEVS